MEELFIKIGELIAMEIDEVKEVQYLEKEMGYVCRIVMSDGKEIVLNLF